MRITKPQTQKKYKNKKQYIIQEINAITAWGKKEKEWAGIKQEK